MCCIFCVIPKIIVRVLMIIIAILLAVGAGLTVWVGIGFNASIVSAIIT